MSSNVDPKWIRERESPSAERNKDPIWNVLKSKVLPLYPKDSTLTILETAAGTGVHAQYFGLKLVELQRPFRYLPTDYEQSNRDSIEAKIDKHSSLQEFVEAPRSLMFTADGASENDLDMVNLIININMVHISPWQATIGLMKTAGQKLKTGGTLFLYGPYRVNGTCVESNMYVF